MSKLRTGAIFTQDILNDVTKAVQSPGLSCDEADTVFQYKVSALQRFLQHGMSRFSIETLQQVLFGLIDSSTNEVDPAICIRSLRDVRAVIKRVIVLRTTASFGTSIVDALRYMELFFYCVYCLSEAKRLFELLYRDLYSSYYSPDDTRPNTSTISRGSTGQSDQRRLPETKAYSRFGISTLDQMTGSERHKLNKTVQDLKLVLDRWTDLLTEDAPNPKSFDAESEEDLVRLHGVSGMESVLRLVPDMFAKYYKCLELTKQWWVLAHEIYPDLPFETRPSVTVDSGRDSGNLSSVASTELYEISMQGDSDEDVDEVSKTLEVIHSLHEEIEVLEKREEKFEMMMDTYNKVGHDIERLQIKRKQLLLDQEYVKAKGISGEVAKMEVEVRGNENSIRLLEFQKALLFEDYAIHLELRPSIVRFLDDAKAQLNGAQTTLTTIRTTQNEIEKLPDQRKIRAEDGLIRAEDGLIRAEGGLAVNHHRYESEYSLQSIERGVQAVSDKCKEFEKIDQTPSKQSLSTTGKGTAHPKGNTKNATSSSLYNYDTSQLASQVLSDKNKKAQEIIGTTREQFVDNRAKIRNKTTKIIDNKGNTVNISDRKVSNIYKSTTNKRESVSKQNDLLTVIKKKSDNLKSESLEVESQTRHNDNRNKKTPATSNDISGKLRNEPSQDLKSKDHNYKSDAKDSSLHIERKGKDTNSERLTNHPGVEDIKAEAAQPPTQRRLSDKNGPGNKKPLTKSLSDKSLSGKHMPVTATSKETHRAPRQPLTNKQIDQSPSKGKVGK